MRTARSRTPRGKLVLIIHRSILSKFGASVKSGAIQIMLVAKEAIEEELFTLKRT
jgi:hypothetical protein